MGRRFCRARPRHRTATALNLCVYLRISVSKHPRRNSAWAPHKAVGYFRKRASVIRNAALRKARSHAATPQMEIYLLPNWMLDRLALSPAQRLHLNAFASALLAILAAPTLVRVPHICLFQYFLHLPCPGFGVTHSLISMGRLDLSGAFRANPAGIVVAAFLGLQLVARPVALFAERLEPAIARLSRRASAFTVAVLMFVWIWRLFVAV